MDNVAAQPECATNLFKCDWQEEYYGWRCKNCDDFIPFGCEPWTPIDDLGWDDDDWSDDDYIGTVERMGWKVDLY